MHGRGGRPRRHAVRCRPLAAVNFARCHPLAAVDFARCRRQLAADFARCRRQLAADFARCRRQLAAVDSATGRFQLPAVDSDWSGIPGSHQ
jgi:hypothetical protein